MTPALIAGKLFALALFTAGAGHAAEVKVLASNALKTTLEELGPQFEKATEHKVSFTFNAAVPLKAEIEKGAAFDVAILSTPITDDSSSRANWWVRRAPTLRARARALPSSGARQNPT
jgi:molybdate transport system substrate-binding protein